MEREKKGRKTLKIYLLSLPPFTGKKRREGKGGEYGVTQGGGRKEKRKRTCLALFFFRIGLI